MRKYTTFFTFTSLASIGESEKIPPATKPFTKLHYSEEIEAHICIHFPLLSVEWKLRGATATEKVESTTWEASPDDLSLTPRKMSATDAITEKT